MCEAGGARKTTMDYSRTDRVADRIREEIAEILTRRVKDPRIGFITVTAVEVSHDLRNAKVFVTVYGDEDHRKAGLKGVQSAARFIRGELGKRLQMKFTPELLFREDTTVDKANRVLELLAGLQGKPEGS